MSTAKKFAVVALAVVTVFSFSSSAGAQTTADLQTQIAALLAQIQGLQAQLAGGSTAASSYSYTRDLTLNATGADVTALQQMLISGGFLKIAAPTSFFGPLTQSALAAWQASVGISPAAGYFGPKTRAYVASTSTGTTTTTTFPAGCTSATGFSSTTGLSCAGTATFPAGCTSAVGYSTTTGLSCAGTTTVSTNTEGTMVVEAAPAPGDLPTVYAGDVNVAIFGVRVKASGNNINVQRVTLDLGLNNAIYNKVIDKLSLWDGSTQLQEVDLNSTTVVKNVLNYQVSFSGFSVTVAKDGFKDLIVKATMLPIIDSAYLTGAAGILDLVNVAFLSVPINGVRAKGGSNIDLYAPGAAAVPAVARSLTVKGTASDLAKLTFSKNTASPKSSAIVTDDDGNSLEPFATVLVADFKAEKDAVKLIDVIVTSTTAGAVEQAVYLYEGSTLLGSASFAADEAIISNSSGLVTIPKDTTKTLTFKVSYSGATSTVATSTINITNPHVIAEASDGTNVAGARLVGSAISDQMNVYTQAPIFAFVSGSASYAAPAFAGASGTLSGSMSFTVNALGDDIYIATSTGLPFTVNYIGGGLDLQATSTTFAQPSGVTLVDGYYKIAENTSATFGVSFTVPSATLVGQAGTTGYYYFSLNNVAWHFGTAGAFIVRVGDPIDYLDVSIWRTPDTNVTQF